jgi:hypothetical protein
VIGDNTTINSGVNIYRDCKRIWFVNFCYYVIYKIIFCVSWKNLLCIYCIQKLNQLIVHFILIFLIFFTFV